MHFITLKRLATTYKPIAYKASYNCLLDYKTIPFKSISYIELLKEHSYSPRVNLHLTCGKTVTISTDPIDTIDIYYKLIAKQTSGEDIEINY